SWPRSAASGSLKFLTVPSISRHLEILFPTRSESRKLAPDWIRKSRCVMQGGRSQQTMPEDRTGWHQINAGPHLEVLFHPNRRPGGREPDQIIRPSIVVAVAGQGEPV